MQGLRGGTAGYQRNNAPSTYDRDNIRSSERDNIDMGGNTGTGDRNNTRTDYERDDVCGTGRGVGMSGPGSTRPADFEHETATGARPNRNIGELSV